MANQTRIKDTRLKALELNFESERYGTFAEIGAGQEVVRWFFSVGAASSTVAKSISAYDMQVSDAIYGESDRYVSRSRLETMLKHEYDLNIERLGPVRGRDTAFFAFADTVAARSYHGTNECHAWLGIRFQAHPGDEPNQLIVHVRMKDLENLQQQEALGIVGVNLVHGATFLSQDPELLLESLVDGVSSERVEIDMVEFSGVEFRQVDNRVMALRLVQLGFSDAAMFSSQGKVLQASEVLYKKPVLVQRGNFRPATKVHLDLQKCAWDEFSKTPGIDMGKAASVLEITMSNLLTDGRLDLADFLDRVDMLSTTNSYVLISNFSEHYRLVNFLMRFQPPKVGLAMGAWTLTEIFDPKYYGELQGSVLEAMGRLCKDNICLYVYPAFHPDDDSVLTAENIPLEPGIKSLHQFLLDRGTLKCLEEAELSYLSICSADVLEMIRKGQTGWENCVPEGVTEAIKDRKLFGYR
jgi:hypothetical protein